MEFFPVLGSNIWRNAMQRKFSWRIVLDYQTGYVITWLRCIAVFNHYCIINDLADRVWDGWLGSRYPNNVILHVFSSTFLIIYQLILLTISIMLYNNNLHYLIHWCWMKTFNSTPGHLCFNILSCYLLRAFGFEN